MKRNLGRRAVLTGAVAVGATALATSVAHAARPMGTKQFDLKPGKEKCLATIIGPGNMKFAFTAFYIDTGELARVNVRRKCNGRVRDLGHSKGRKVIWTQPGVYEVYVQTSESGVRVITQHYDCLGNCTPRNSNGDQNNR